MKAQFNCAGVLSTLGFDISDIILKIDRRKRPILHSDMEGASFPSGRFSNNHGAILLQLLQRFRLASSSQLLLFDNGNHFSLEFKPITHQT